MLSENMIQKDLADKDDQVNGETVRANLELSPQRKPLSKAQAMFYKALHEAEGDKAKKHPWCWSIQVSYCAEVGALGCRELAARYVNEGEGHVQEGRQPGARRIYIAGDLTIELGLLCTGNDDVGELSEMYGPLCWQFCDAEYDNMK